MKRFVCSAVILFVVLFLSASAFANSGELLTFQGLGDMQTVGNFYNGSGIPGTPNYGVSFSSNFFGLSPIMNGGSGNFAPFANGSGDPHAIFISNSMTGPSGLPVTGIMNVTAGFSSGLNFFFTAGFAPGQAETVSVWSGANGTGTVLATISLANNNAGCGAPLYCNWSDASLSFKGTAQSVTFSGPSDELGLTAITIGSSTTAVPEPSTIYLLGAGLACVSLGKLRRYFSM